MLDSLSEEQAAAAPGLPPLQSQEQSAWDQWAESVTCHVLASEEGPSPHLRPQPTVAYSVDGSDLHLWRTESLRSGRDLTAAVSQNGSSAAVLDAGATEQEGLLGRKSSATSLGDRDAAGRRSMSPEKGIFARSSMQRRSSSSNKPGSPKRGSSVLEPEDLLTEEKIRRTQRRWRQIKRGLLQEYCNLKIEEFDPAQANHPINLPRLLLKWRRLIGIIAAVEKMRIRDIFVRFDTDNDGSLDRCEIYGASRLFELGFDAYESNALFDALDTNKDGGIDLPEFTADVKIVHEASEFFSPNPEQAPLTRDVLETRLAPDDLTAFDPRASRRRVSEQSHTTSDLHNTSARSSISPTRSAADHRSQSVRGAALSPEPSSKPRRLTADASPSATSQPSSALRRGSKANDAPTQGLDDSLITASSTVSPVAPPSASGSRIPIRRASSEAPPTPAEAASSVVPRQPDATTVPTLTADAAAAPAAIEAKVAPVEHQSSGIDLLVGEDDDVDEFVQLEQALRQAAAPATSGSSSGAAALEASGHIAAVDSPSAGHHVVTKVTSASVNPDAEADEGEQQSETSWHQLHDEPSIPMDEDEGSLPATPRVPASKSGSVRMAPRRITDENHGSAAGDKPTLSRPTSGEVKLEAAQLMMRPSYVEALGTTQNTASNSHAVNGPSATIQDTDDHENDDDDDDDDKEDMSQFPLPLHSTPQKPTVNGTGASSPEDDEVDERQKEAAFEIEL